MDVKIISLDIDNGSHCEEALCALMCCLNALYTIERSAHWMAKPDNFYADHLLFQRLYEAIPDEIDKLAEKMAVDCGLEVLRADVLSQGACDKVCEILDSCSADPFEQALCAENCVLDSIQAAMDAIDASDLRKLGWDDLLGEMTSKHEEHIYLLKHSI